MTERPISAVIERCQWRPDHDRVLDVPIGPMCGRPATKIIYWLDGSERYSPCCDDHVRDIGPEAPTHAVLRLGRDDPVDVDDQMPFFTDIDRIDLRRQKGGPRWYATAYSGERAITVSRLGAGAALATLLSQFSISGGMET